MSDAKILYGLVAEFKSTSAVYNAAKRVKDAGFKNWDVLAPFPIHGIDKVMGIPRSKVPRFTLLGGITGFSLGMFIVWFMNSFDYPLIVGGKPFFSPIFPFPVFYELTILLAAFGTFFGMFISNRLPMHYHPIFNKKWFSRATDDHFYIVIETKDPQFHQEQTKAFLEELGGMDITLVEEKS